MAHITPIRTEADHKAALERIDALMDAEAGSAEADELSVLADLVEAYEARRFPIELPTPVEAIRQRSDCTFSRGWAGLAGANQRCAAAGDRFVIRRALKCDARIRSRRRRRTPLNDTQARGPRQRQDRRIRSASSIGNLDDGGPFEIEMPPKRKRYWRDHGRDLILNGSPYKARPTRPSTRKDDERNLSRLTVPVRPSRPTRTVRQGGRSEGRRRNPRSRGRGIPCSRDDPKILRRYHAEIVCDCAAIFGPISRDFVAQELQSGLGEFFASVVGFVVRDVLVHDAP